MPVILFRKGKHLIPTLYILFTSHLCDLRMATSDFVIHHEVSEWLSNTCSSSLRLTDLIDYNGSAKSIH